MPKASFKDIQLTLLKEYGLAVEVSDDGTFDIKEKTGRGGGLPVRKSRAIKVHATSDPGGSVSRGQFNLQSMMHLSDADYKLVCNSAKEVINQTRRINKDLSFQKQDPNVIELCVDKLIERHPELHAYDLYGRWGPRAFFKKLLRTSSCKANAISKLEKDLAKLEATVKEEQARNQPAGGEQAVVPQDAVASGAAAEQQAAAPAAMPAKKRGRPKKVRSPELESKPVIDSAPAVAAPPAPNGAPATVAQPDPGVVAQPPPPVIPEQNKPAPSAPTQSAPPDQPAPQVTPTDPTQVEPAVPREKISDGEVIDMDLHDEPFNIDMTMNSVVHDLSQFSIRKGAGKNSAGDIIEIGDDDDDDDDDDGGKFDMALTMNKPTLKPATKPTAKPTAETTESTVEPTVEPSVEPTAESTATSHNAPPATSVSAPAPDFVAPGSPSPSSVVLPSTVSVPSNAPDTRVLRKRATKDDPPAPPAAPADPSIVTPKDNAASSALLAGPKLTPTTPFMSTPTAIVDSDIMWHGILIAPVEMNAIRLAAKHQVQGGRPMRMAPIFDGLIAKFMANPEYDPSSEPDAPPEPPAPIKGRRRGRTVAPTTAANPNVPVEIPPVTEQPKAQPKAQPKRKPKVKPVPEPAPAPESEPELASDEHTTDKAAPDASDANGMEVDTPAGEGSGGQKGNGRQQAAKGGAKAKSNAAATTTKASKAPKEPKVPAAPLRTSARTTRANPGTG
ncbi:hypothetical protein FRC09_000631 [Ceratobasidium sp. 395]|nr:hypothetical protein FRC09_000631 [Ceratobasidium sp. 395]